MDENIERLANRYRRFAAHEANGVSATYEAYAKSISDNKDLLERIAALPPGKQQPNLLFASARKVVGLTDKPASFAHHALRAWAEIKPVILGHATQTNEPGRCACILPVLAQFDEPLAILEVGAAAGLCLLPDKYGYDYGEAVLSAPTADAPIFPCRMSGDGGIPQRLPEIAWRAGLDVNPLDVRNSDDMDWLRLLVWPEQTERRARLDAAISVARHDPPNVMPGDLLAQTEALAASTPTGTRLVIFHTAVLNYVSPQVRMEFATLVRDLGATWIANEGASILPDTASDAVLKDRPEAFVLSLNGKAVARTGPHGQYFDWL